MLTRVMNNIFNYAAAEPEKTGLIITLDYDKPAPLSPPPPTLWGRPRPTSPGSTKEGRLPLPHVHEQPLYKR